MTKTLRGKMSYTYCTQEYCNELREHIRKNYIPISHDKEATVEFQLIVDRGGDLCFIKKIVSSNCDCLDQHALETIKKSFPFKSFPEKTFQSYIDLLLPITFKSYVS